MQYIYIIAIALLLACSNNNGADVINDDNILKQDSLGQDSIPVQTMIALDSSLYNNFYFISPKGSDTNPGTFEEPFASLQKANTVVQPGDMVYLRGGTYNVVEDQISKKESIFAYVILFDKNGTKSNYIHYWAYPEETPIFDFTQVKLRDYRVYAFSVTGSRLHFKGIKTRGVQVTIKEHTQSICFYNTGNYNVFEQLEMCDNQAIGYYGMGTKNLIVNCDAHDNWDYTSESGNGGNVDGFGCHTRDGDYGNLFYGCRAWFNSDDGYDLISCQYSVTIENCWAAYNGYSSGFIAQGDGNGFKAGGYGNTSVNRLPNPIPRHIVKGCLAVKNKQNGLYANHHLEGGDWINNTAYLNKRNFNMLCRAVDNVTDIPGFRQVLTDNLSYNSTGGTELTNINKDECQLSNNSFDLTLKDDDFVSFNQTQLFATRKVNGDLPDITLMSPTSQSKAVGIGCSAYSSRDVSSMINDWKIN